MLRSILIALDGSPSSLQAARRGLELELAHHHRAQVQGLGIVNSAWIQRPEAVPIGGMAYKIALDMQELKGATEQWNIFNFTADSHPIHLHLVQYQVVEKRHIDFRDADEDGVPDDTNHDGKITYGKGSRPNYEKADIWIGAKEKLRPEETGWQDTVHVDPNEMMSVVAKFDRPGEYVWHCHILSHEDNEMMRPYRVVDPDLIA